MAIIATLFFVLGIVGLFLLDGDNREAFPKQMLLPLIWLLIAGSRNLNQWFTLGKSYDAATAYLEGSAIDRNILSLLIAAGLFILWKRRRMTGALLRANIPLMLYFSFCLISLVWSDFPLVGFKRWTRAIGDLVMVLIVLTEKDWYFAWKRLYKWAAYLLLPLSILFIRYFPNIGISYSPYDSRVFWNGVTTTKNELGMVCLVFGLAGLSRVLNIIATHNYKRKAKELVSSSIVTIMASGILYNANSATSLACFVIGSILLLLTSYRPFTRNIALTHCLVSALILIAVSALFLGVGSSLVSGLGRKSDLTGRTEMWGYALKLVNNPLLGSGYESFWLGPRLDKMLIVAPGVNQAHNGYLEIYLNLGWIGVFLLAYVFLDGYYWIMLAFQRNPSSGRLGLTYFVVAISYNFTEGAFKFRDPIWISLLIAIMAARMIGQRHILIHDAPVSTSWFPHRSQKSIF